MPVEVLASSNDESLESHVHLAEMTMAHVRCELECGRDVIVLVDSITRMTRAFNLAGRGVADHVRRRGCALEIPRRFFGLARNIEHGGSVTVIATTLVETGSSMDDLIYEEFKRRATAKWCWIAAWPRRASSRPSTLRPAARGGTNFCTAKTTTGGW
ncbi:MAG: hypothetical protein R2854_17660 [Caldilineaceae bacterium]